MIDIKRLSDDEINNLWKKAEDLRGFNNGIMYRAIINTELLMRILEKKL